MLRLDLLAQEPVSKCRDFKVKSSGWQGWRGCLLPEPLTPRSLDTLLAQEGWRPPLDLLEKAAEWAP